MNSILEIEKTLSRKFKRKYCVLTGSGTTAIYLTLKALGLKDAAVLMPSICCYSPAYAIKYAGLDVDFCDIALDDGCITPQSIVEALDSNPRIKVLIGVHLYGNVLELDKIMSICAERNIYFIEDVCQAFGSHYGSVPCGAMGDFSILSFGHSKILNAGGLGAVLTDNKDAFYSIANMIKEINSYDHALLTSLWNMHRSEYYRIKTLVAQRAGEKRLFGELMKGYQDLFIHGINLSNVQSLSVLLKNSKLIFNHRIMMSNMCRKLLEDCKDISFVDSHYQTVPWRFSFLVRSGLNEHLCDEIRKEGLDISSWYPDLSPMFLGSGTKVLANAACFEKKIVNIWVDNTKNETYIKSVCSKLKQTVNS